MNKDGVTVTFEALEEALEGVVVTVVDPEGNEVEVEAQDLEEGATSAVFVFVEALEKDPTTGVWTVNGVEYDFDEFAAVKAVKDATNLVELWEALQSDYFTGAVEENIEAYDAADKSELVTAEDVNKMIADVNASLVDAETVIKPIVDATNELELLRALQNGGFKDVNSKLIDEYKKAMKDTEETKVTLKTTVEEVQNIIYEVNATAAVDALFEDEVLAEKVDQAQIDAAKALVEKLPEEDQAILMGRVETAQALLDAAAKLAEATEAVEALFVDAETKAELAAGVDQDAIDTAQELVTALADGSEKTALQESITVAQNLFDAIAARLEIKDTISVVNKLRSDDVYVLGYWVEIDVNKGGAYKVDDKSVTVDDTESIVIQLYKGDTLLGEQTFVNYDNVNNSDNYTPGQSTVGGTIDVYGDYDSTSWDNVWYKGLTDIPDTAKAIVKYPDGRVVEAKKPITGLVVTPFYEEALNRTETVADMSVAIIELEEILNNDKVFTNLSKADKPVIAQMVLDARDKKDTKKFALNGTEAYLAVTTAMTKRTEFIDAINGATNIATMKEALDNEVLFPEFFGLGTLEKNNVAETVYNALKAFKEGEKFETIAEIKAAAGL